MPRPEHRPLVVIVGAGPSGLIAADILSQNNCEVHIYDQKPSPARKFLMAGRGGLNITHSETMEPFLDRYGTARKYMEPFIRAFTPQDVRAWCEDLGQKTFVGSSGRVFPESMKASPLLRILLNRLDQRGVKLSTNHRWAGWDKNCDLLFYTKENRMVSAKPDFVILALGGASWPSLGSDGMWQNLLAASGIGINPFLAANCGFAVEWSDHIKTKFAGTPLKSIAIHHDDKAIKGEIMIDRNGIEGGAIYALSSALRDDIANNRMAKITIDLKPDMNRETLIRKISNPRGKTTFSTWIKKTLHLNPVSIALLYETVPDIQKAAPEMLADAIKKIPLTLTSPFGIERSISSAGGIDWNNVDETLQLRQIPDVWVAGEMLDWEAPTGGYLLQACLSTGVAAARGILSRMAEK